MDKLANKNLPKSFYIASDHAGYALKSYLIESLSTQFTIHDLGTDGEDSVDYPDYAKKLCDKMDDNHFGVLICGSGIGMSISANRFAGIRAALCFNDEHVRLSRGHNNANVLVLGARLLEKEQALQMVKEFYTTEFEGGRHLNRVKKL